MSCVSVETDIVWDMSQHAQNPLTRDGRIPAVKPEGDLSVALYRPRHEAIGRDKLVARRRCTSRDPSTGGMFKMSCRQCGEEMERQRGERREGRSDRPPWRGRAGDPHHR